MTHINRRDVILRLSALLGAAFTEPLSAGVLGKKTYFGPVARVSQAQETLLAEMADVIIPPTTTPGAKEAGVQNFIVRVIRDCHEKKEQDAFYEGLSRLDKTAKDKFGKGFSALSPDQKILVVRHAETHDKDFFQQMKSLTVTGYFTSEAGATQALDYLPVPGRFEGSYPLRLEQKTWAL